MTNYDIIRAHYAGSDNRDLDAMLAPITAETAWTEMAGFPCAGTYHGPEEIVENVFKALGEAWENYTLKVERILDAGDTVIGVGTYSGTFKETGKHMEARVTHVWDLKDGKVIRFEQFTDTLLVAEAMKS
ncbi:nuclear transport factor 2 family protein [Roseibium sp. SCP14]|uniref:nuclear transport factor 2 family protein n=1 Tax=Roseibium sp. SCP14 TaxID=3141375 RepID=UPI003A97D6D6